MRPRRRWRGRARGRPLGPARGLAGSRRPHGAAGQRQGARLRLDRRPAERGLPGPRPHPGHGWDPATDAHSLVPVDTGFNLFCSGLAHLMDGTLFFAGGNKNANLDGIRQTHYFDSETNRLWAEYARRSVVSERDPARQRRDADHRGLSRHARGAHDRGRHPRAHDRGPEPAPLPVDRRRAQRPRVRLRPEPTMRSLNPAGTGSWTTMGQRDAAHRSYGSRALYDIGKILVAGGSASRKDAVVVNINGSTPQVTPTAPMANGRRQHNLTVLADGTVLATGGNSSGPRSSTSRTASTPPSSGTRPPASGRRSTRCR